MNIYTYNFIYLPYIIINTLYLNKEIHSNNNNNNVSRKYLFKNDSIQKRTILQLRFSLFDLLFVT